MRQGKTNKVIVTGESTMLMLQVGTPLDILEQEEAKAFIHPFRAAPSNHLICRISGTPFVAWFDRDYVDILPETV